VAWEVTHDVGEAAIMRVSDVGSFVSRAAACDRSVQVRRTELALPELDDNLLGRISPHSETLQYLLGYVHFLDAEQRLTDSAVARATATHLRDLVALMLGTKRGAAVRAEGRGLRAARLQAIKHDVSRNLDRGGLSVGAVAARHRVTPRYVQLLFEAEGTTFSEHVLDQRLARARRMLSDPRNADRTIIAIALEAGFGDVSYFNRRFRRRYGRSPTQFRAAAGGLTKSIPRRDPAVTPRRTPPPANRLAQRSG
jgi:AraC-like DNA-binding protein